MFNRKTIIVLGTSSLIFGAAVANAQLDVDAAGRAAGGVGAAGRAAGEIGAEAEAGAGIDGAVRGASDAQIGVHVQAQLSQQLAMPGVRSDVHNGVATLNGTVANEADKQRAEQIARRIEGVTRVRNELVVEHAGSVSEHLEQQARATGPSTEAAVASRLNADTRLAQHDIDVRTRNDVVTLTGEVSSVAEKESAGKIAAETAPGVEVRNRLTVRSKN